MAPRTKMKVVDLTDKKETPPAPVEKPTPVYDPTVKLPQTPESYTSLAIVKTRPGHYVLRQVDVVDGQIVNIIDSKENAKAIVFDYFRVAAADLMFAGV